MRDGALRWACICVAATVAAATLGGARAVQASSAHRHVPYDGRAALREMGYLSARSPIHMRAKQRAAAAAPAPAHAPRVIGSAPVRGVSWNGVHDASVSPPDPNGAVGPNGYVEIINTRIGIYTRAGAPVVTGTLQTLTGHSQSALSDPMVLWDPGTQRFYYNVWDTEHSTMAFGFSKSRNPTNLSSAWCRYTGNFGYSASEAPDYPKLGQTAGFLLIGVDYYPTFSSMLSTRSDLLWVTKPQGSTVISTCPAAASLATGRISDLRNADGSQAFTPVPAIQTDPSASGYVVASSDIEDGSAGSYITVFTVAPSTANPSVPAVSAPHELAVPSYSDPPNAPQLGTDRRLDTLDGRLEHAVSAIDPSNGNVQVWTSHSVAGGAGSEARWYEISPTPLGAPTMTQSGVISHPSLYVYNDAVSPDRTVNPSGRAHGSAMVSGFTTSSTTTDAAVRMVSKLHGGTQSGFVLVKSSPGPDVDRTCSKSGSTCRWGDYGGATPDPAAALSSVQGSVWLTNEWNAAATDPLGVWSRTWNWRATP